MANNFTSDPSCKALWRFEPDALTTDSIGENTLSLKNAPTVDETAPMEGEGCLLISHASDQGVYITDANLNAGFPLKSGDTTKQITICGWFKPTSQQSATVVGKWGATDGEMCFLLVANNNSWSFGWEYYPTGYGNIWRTGIGSISNGIAYHYGLVIDGVAQTYKLRIWDGSSVVVDTNTFVFPLLVGTGAFTIGNLPASNSAIDGREDEVVVFNRLLTDDEIDDIRSGAYVCGDVNVACTTVPITLTEYQSNINAAINVNASADSLTLSTFAASVKNIISINANTTSLTLTTNQAQIIFPTNILADVAVLSMTTYPVSVTGMYVEVFASAVSLALQEFVADVDLDVSVFASVSSLTLQTYNVDVATNINAATNILAIRKRLFLYTYPVEIDQGWPVKYGDWRDTIGDRTWSNNFKEQQDKWGYLNNPRWQTSPQPPVSYTGNEANEPQIWTPPGQKYSDGNSVIHIPCGHWHKRLIPTSEQTPSEDNMYVLATLFDTGDPDYNPTSTFYLGTWPLSPDNSVITWIPIIPGDITPSAFYYGVFSYDTNVIIMRFDPGNFYISVDRGITWSLKQLDGITGRYWYAIDLSEDGKYIIAGYLSQLYPNYNNAKIFLSSNYGVNFIEIFPKGVAGGSWKRCSVSKSGQYIIVGSDNIGSVHTHFGNDGKIYVSQDYGVTWTEKQPLGSISSVAGLTSCYFKQSDDGKYVYCYIKDDVSGSVAVSLDYGSTFNIVDTNAVAIESMAISSDGKYVIIAGCNTPSTYGRVFLSINYGYSFNEIRPNGDVDNNWYYPHISEDGQYIIIKGNSGLFVSSDGGSSWSNPIAYISIFRVSDDGKRIIAIGSRIYYSYDGLTFQETQPLGNVDQNWNIANICSSRYRGGWY